MYEASLIQESHFIVFAPKISDQLERAGKCEELFLFSVAEMFGGICKNSAEL